MISEEGSAPGMNRSWTESAHSPDSTSSEAEGQTAPRGSSNVVTGIQNTKSMSDFVGKCETFLSGLEVTENTDSSFFQSSCTYWTMVKMARCKVGLTLKIR